MLVKLSDNFFIDMQDVFLVDKQSKEIKIYVRSPTPNNQPFTISSLSKEGKEFLKAIQLYSQNAFEAV